MGWLSMMRSAMGENETPKRYLDAQLTYEHEAEGENPLRGCRVLKSVYSGSTYYAAVERYDVEGNTVYVIAIICLVRWNPKAADGYIFAYKDMEEGSGPNECKCPRSILELLSPTDHPWANDWRNRCYRSLRLRERRLEDGNIIRFPEPMKFTDGSEHREVRVGKEGRKIVLMLEDGSGRYKVSRLMERAFEIVRERPKPKTIFPTP